MQHPRFELIQSCMCLITLAACLNPTRAESPQKPGDVGRTETLWAIPLVVPGNRFNEKIPVPQPPPDIEFGPMPLPNPDDLSIVMPTPAPDLPPLTGYDARTGQVEYLNWEDIGFAPPPPDTDPASWIESEGRGEMDGSEGEDEREGWATRNFSSPLVRIADPTPWPYRPNCKLQITYTNAAGNQVNTSCSGTLIDARHIVTAGHCVFIHRDNNNQVLNNWINTMRVIPAKNNADEPYCDSQGNYWLTYTCWTAGPNWDCDLAVVTVDRPVGALTGWFGYGTRPGCARYRDAQNPFFNRGYPLGNSGGAACNPQAFNGLEMFDWSGTFDRCESRTNIFGETWFGNEVGHNRLSYGGQSGSSAYTFINNSRQILAILSNGTCPPGATTSYAAVDQATTNQWRGRIQAVTPNTPDLVPLNERVLPAANRTVVAGQKIFGIDYFVHNYSTANRNGIVLVTHFLSADRVITPADTQILASGFVWNFGPKTSVRASVGVGIAPRVPVNTPSGNYFLGLRLDQPDADTGNNITLPCDVAEITVVGVGACCLPTGECLPRRTQADCALLGGTYRGDTSVCGPQTCPPVLGTCCRGDGTCGMETQADCIANFGQFMGNMTCEQIGPCPNWEACCYPAGQCLLQSASYCNLNGGTIPGQPACNPNPCPQAQAGACCDADGVCVVLTDQDCATIGGVFLGPGSQCNGQGNGAPAGAGGCPQVNGACCAGIVCQQSTEEPCVNMGGTYLGDGTLCGVQPCPQPEPTGACCDGATGFCVEATQADCAFAGLDYRGDGTTCDTVLCAENSGACCLPNNTCVQLILPGCNLAGGEYLGDDTQCGVDPCPVFATGACCSPAGGCVELTQAECIGGLNVYSGDGTTCDPSPCPQPAVGACCLSDGTCLVLSQVDCGATDALFLGAGANCPGALCLLPTGGCCDAAGFCTLQTQIVCAGGGGTYLGDGSGCAHPTCGLIGDMNCDGVISVSDIGGFVLALTQPEVYDAVYPNCRRSNGDVNGDGFVTVGDIAGFVALITGS